MPSASKPFATDTGLQQIPPEQPTSPPSSDPQELTIERAVWPYQSPQGILPDRIKSKISRYS